MPSRMTRIMYWTAAAVAGAFAVVVWVLHPMQEGRAANVYRPRPAPVDAASPVAEHRPTKVPNAAPGLEAEPTRPLSYLCPSLQGDFSADCMAELDRRFLDENGGFFRRVFDDPVATRAAVGEALGDPACIVPEGQFHPQLRETCAADAVVTLARLHSSCVRTLSMDEFLLESGRGGMATHIEESYHEDLDTLAGEARDQEDYWRRLAKLEESVYYHAWVLRKCRAVPREAFVWVQGLPVNRGEGEPGQFSALYSLARRLGSKL